MEIEVYVLLFTYREVTGKITANNMLLSVPMFMASGSHIFPSFFPTKSLTFPCPQEHLHSLFIPMSKPFAFILIGLEYENCSSKQQTFDMAQIDKWCFDSLTLI